MLWLVVSCCWRCWPVLAAINQPQPTDSLAVLLTDSHAARTRSHTHIHISLQAKRPSLSGRPEGRRAYDESPDDADVDGPARGAGEEAAPLGGGAIATADDSAAPPSISIDSVAVRAIADSAAGSRGSLESVASSDNGGGGEAVALDEMPANGTVLHSGWFNKKGGKMTTKWQKRFAEVCGVPVWLMFFVLFCLAKVGSLPMPSCLGLSSDRRWVSRQIG